MSWAEVEELYAAGWAVEAHTATHPDLRRLTDDAIRDEFQRGNDAIQAHLGCRPTIVAYPYGFWDERVRDLAASAYRYAVTTQMGVLPVEVIDPHLIPRLETYYIRAPKIHSHFGTRTFSAYLAARTMLRRLKHVD